MNLLEVNIIDESRSKDYLTDAYSVEHIFIWSFSWKIWFYDFGLEDLTTGN